MAVGEMAVDWMALDTKSDTAESAAVIPTITKEKTTAAVTRPKVVFPSDIETLKAMIVSGAALPGNDYGTGFIAPVGPTSCKVMVISDLPDMDELAAKSLGSGKSGALLNRMLAAIGLDLADCYWTALATTIPATADIPENDLNELGDFTRHQISLVRPQSLILLGSSACKALLGGDLMQMRQSLQNINHHGSNMAVLTTFHPRKLIARPAMKAQAWKDLQMFAKRTDL